MQEILEAQDLDYPKERALGINLELIKGASLQLLELQDGCPGFCNFCIIRCLSPYRGMVAARHLVGLSMQRKTSLDNGVAAMHEFEHVAQSLEDPSYPYDDEPFLDKRLSDELRGCYVGRTYGDVLIDLSGEENPVYEKQKHIDNLRKLVVTKEAPFSAPDFAKPELFRHTGVDSYNRGRVEVPAK